MSSLSATGYPLFLVASLNLALCGLMLSDRSRRSKLAQHAAAMALFNALYAGVVGLAYVRAAQGLDPELPYRAAWVGWVAIAPAVQIALHLRDPEHPRARRIATGLYALWGGVLVLCLGTDLVDRAPSSLFPYVDRGGPLEMPVRLLAVVCIGMLLAHLHRTWRSATGRKRQRAAYLLLGIAAYAVPGMIFSGVLPVLGVPVDPGLTAYWTVLWSAATFHAVSRDRLYDVRLVLSRVLSSVTLISLSSIFHVATFQLLEGEMGPSGAIVIATLVTAVLLFVAPTIAAVRTLVEELLLRDADAHRQAFRASSEALVTILDLDALLEKLVEVARTCLRVQSAKLLLRDADGSYRLGSARMLRKQSALARWVESKDRVLVREEVERELSEEELEPLADDLLILGGEVAVSIRYKGAQTGVLVVGERNDRGAFVESDIEMLETLARQAAIAIENARLFDAASTDGLTGLYHHKYFRTRLPAELERARRHDTGVVLLLVDIDFFKQVNDVYGHLTGDAVLREISAALRTIVRKEDLVCRYGGEEFAILLTESGPDQAKETAERIRKEVASRTWSDGLKLSVSIGVSVYERATPPITDTTLIQQADDALYRAKRGGRNRVEIAPRSTLVPVPVAVPAPVAVAVPPPVPVPTPPPPAPEATVVPLPTPSHSALPAA